MALSIIIQLESTTDISCSGYHLECAQPVSNRHRKIICSTNMSRKKRYYIFSILTDNYHRTVTELIHNIVSYAPHSYSRSRDKNNRSLLLKTEAEPLFNLIHMASKNGLTYISQLCKMLTNLTGQFFRPVREGKYIRFRISVHNLPLKPYIK